MDQTTWLLLFLALAQINGTAQPKVSHNVIGKVTIGPDRAPVPGILLELHSAGTMKTYTAFTTPDGVYFFDCLEDGEYELSINTEGFLSKRIGGIRFLYPDTVVLDIEMHAKRGGGEVIPGIGPSVTVRVLDATNTRYIANAAVSIVRPGFVSHRKTDNCGRAFWVVPPGEYLLRISADGYSEKQLTRSVGREHVAVTVYLEKR